MSGRQVYYWNGGGQQYLYDVRYARPVMVSSRQIQANNRIAAAETQQITRALSSNGPEPITVSYNIKVSYKMNN